MEKRKLGKYEIFERLGRGGMAEVYRAYHATLDRFVAIKILHNFLADDAEFASRFTREAQNIARLKHAHIVQVYDFDYDTESESYYMVMELITGETLKDRLFQMEKTGETPSLEETLRIIREAASALAYAHRNGMIHRDVKPANLMLDTNENDRVVLTDFGIAKIVTGSQFTVTGGLVGTPAYMAPEQGVGETGDERSDLYSLGVILYQMVTGELPYDAETPLALILKHLNEPIPSACEKNPNLPPEVDVIIQKLMAKEPDNRYKDASELITDIRTLETALLRNDDTPIHLIAAPSNFEQAVALDDTPEVDSPTVPFIKKQAIKQSETPPPYIQPAQTQTSGRGGGIWLALVIILLGGMLVGGYIIGANSGVFPAIGFLASNTPTITPSDTPTQTPTPTDTPTSTPTTATDMPTRTPSPTPTDGATLTNTPTQTPVITLTPSLTPNVTLTFAAERTATTEACIFDYDIIDQEPPNGEEGGFFPVNSTYIRRITVQNTGTCPWEVNSSLAFIPGSGESFRSNRVVIPEVVEVGDVIEIELELTLPSTGSVTPYTGLWQFRTRGQLPIGDPFEISILVFFPGDGS